MLVILLYVIAIGALWFAADRQAREADARQDEIERRRTAWLTHRP